MSKNKETKEENALTTTGSTEVMVPEGCLGVGDDYTADDLQRPFVTIMQGLSDFVTDGEAAIGEIRSYPDNELLAAKGGVFEFMLAGQYCYWVEQDGPGKDGKFLCKFPGISEQELPWEGVTDEGKVYRYFHRAYIMLPVKDIEAGLSMPYELALRSTMLKYAKRFNSLVKKLRDSGKASWEVVFGMGTQLIEKDGNKWFVPTFFAVREASDKEREAAKVAYLEFNALKQQFPEKQDTIIGQAAPPIDEDAQY